MTWAEFQIRSYGWKRQDERESYKLRKVGFAAMWAFHGDFKRLPKSENKFWQIGDVKAATTTEEQEAIKAARINYLKQKNNNNG